MHHPHASRFALAALLAAASPALGQTTYWLGANGTSLNTASNWSGVNATVNGAIMTFNGNSTGNLSLTFNSNLGGSSGGSISLTGSQTGSLSITNSATALTDIRFASGTSFQMDSGAGAFSLGASGNAMRIVLGSGAGTYSFVNNSASLATFGSQVSWIRGGASTTSVLEFGGSGNFLVEGTVGSSQNLTLTKKGAGTLTLSGINTMVNTSGPTTVEGGVLLATKAAALPLYTTNGKVVINGGTLGVRMTGGSTTGWAQAEVNTLLTNATKTSGALGIDTTNADLTQWTAFTTTNLGSTLGLHKLGTNTLTLNQANSYTGSTTISNGVLLATLTTALPGYTTNGKVVINGGTLGVRMTGGSTTGWSGADVNTLLTNATKTSGALGIDTTNADLTQWTAFTTTNLGSTLGLHKLGTNTLTLNNLTNNFTGNVSVTGGTLALLGNTNAPNPTASAIGNTQVARTLTVGSGATLRFDDSNVMGTAGSTPLIDIIVNGGTVTNAGNWFTTLGNITLNGGSLTGIGGALAGFQMYSFQSTSAVTVGGSSASTISGSGDNSSYHLGANTIFNVADATNNSDADLIVSGVLIDQVGAGGAGAFTKNGSGTMVLSGVNSYTGNTNVNGGVLLATMATALPGHNSSNKVVINGGTLGVRIGNGTNGWTTALVDTLFANATKTSGALGIDTTNGDLSQWTAFTTTNLGPLGLTKLGENTLTLTNTANTFTGNVSVNQGTLSIASAQLGTNSTFSAIGNPQTVGRQVTIASGATLNFGATDQLGNAYSVPKLTLVNNGGTITNSGAQFNTLGNIILNGGTLTGTGGNIGAFQMYNLAGSVTVNDDATISGIGTNSGYHLSATNTTFDVAAGKTLTASASFINTADFTSASAGLIKTGDGILDLSGASTYTGGTTINAGTIRISGGTNRLPTAGAVVLASTAGAILDLNGNNQTIGSLSGGGANGGAVTLGSGVLTVGDTTSTTFAGVISGTNGRLIKTGSGVLTLSGANSYTGNTTINAGTIRISSADRLPTAGAVNLANTAGAILDLNGNNQTIGSLAGGGASGGAVTLGSGVLTVGDGTSTTFSGVISGTGRLIKNGAGTLTLGGVNTYTGNTTINAGTITLSGNDRLATGGAVILANTAGATLNLGNFNQTIGSLSGGGANGGNVTLGSGVLTVGDASSTNFSGVISGANGRLVKNGVGTLTLAGANTYTGNTTINAGTITLSGNDRLATGGAVILANAGGATLNLGNNNQTIGSLSGGGASGGNVTLGSGVLTVGDASSTNFSGVISGANGRLIKNGAGTLTLGGVNTYTGNTTINAGTITLSGNDRLATTGAVVLASTGGATLNLGNNNQTIGSLSGGGASGGNVTLGSGILTVGDNTSTSFAGVISGTGRLIKNGSGTLTLSGANSYSGNTTINAGTITLSGNDRLASTGAVVLANAAGATLNLNNNNQAIGSLAGGGSTGGAVTLGSGVLAVGDTTSTTFDGVISGTNGRLIKTGSGVLTLSGANSYTGNTTINAGTIQISGGINRLPTAGAVILANTAGAILDLNGNNQTIGSLAGGGTTGGAVTLGGGVLTVGDANDTTFGGVISGSGGLTKTGGGALTLNNNNTYIGATNINGGTLSLTGGLLSSTTVTINNGGTLRIGASGDRLQTTTALTINAGGTFDLRKNQQIATLSGAGDIVGSVGAFALTVGSGSYSGIHSGTTGFTKNTAGTLTLGGANSYKGATTVSGGGKLIINGDQSLATGATTVTGAGTRLMGSGTLGGALTIGSGAIHAPGNSPGLQTVNGLTTYQTDSIFEWDLSNYVNGTSLTQTWDHDNNVNTSPITARGSAYDAVNLNGGLTVQTNAIFKVITDLSFDNAFWQVDQLWSNIFKVTGTVSGWAANTPVAVYDTSGQERTVSSYGSFTMSGTTLAWDTSYIPEPSTALAGLLLAAGLLRRRRVS